MLTVFVEIFKTFMWFCFKLQIIKYEGFDILHKFDILYLTLYLTYTNKAWAVRVVAAAATELHWGQGVVDLL